MDYTYPVRTKGADVDTTPDPAPGYDAGIRLMRHPSGGVVIMLDPSAAEGLSAGQHRSSAAGCAEQPAMTLGDDMSTERQAGSFAMQAWNKVRVMHAERKFGQDGYRVQRVRAEPVGYNRDGSIMTSTGLPFWVPANMLKDVD